MILFCFIDFDFDFDFELALALEKEEVNKKFVVKVLFLLFAIWHMLSQPRTIKTTS